MDECIRHFEAVCTDKRYRILTAQSKRDVRDVDPGTKEYRTSELTALCDRDSAQFAAAAASSTVVAPPPVAPPPAAPPPAPAPVAPPVASVTAPSPAPAAPAVAGPKAGDAGP
jgi:hypothetical protein